MKKKDRMLGTGMIAIAFVMLLAMHFTREEGEQVIVQINGRMYGTYDLHKDQEIEIKSGDQYNKIRIQGGQVMMEEADCPDGYCKEQGKISARTQTIVCLPHRVVVEVAGRGETKDADPDTIAK